MHFKKKNSICILHYEAHFIVETIHFSICASTCEALLFDWRLHCLLMCTSFKASDNSNWNCPHFSVIDSLHLTTNAAHRIGSGRHGSQIQSHFISVSPTATHQTSWVCCVCTYSVKKKIHPKAVFGAEYSKAQQVRVNMLLDEHLGLRGNKCNRNTSEFKKRKKNHTSFPTAGENKVSWYGGNSSL